MCIKYIVIKIFKILKCHFQNGKYLKILKDKILALTVLDQVSYLIQFEMKLYLVLWGK